jgi:hypothetical protein
MSIMGSGFWVQRFMVPGFKGIKVQESAYLLA